MLLSALILPLLPVLAALHFPGTPQDALKAANGFLPSGSADTLLRLATDISLDDLGGGDEFVTLTSARHPGHSVRIKETTGWCDPDARSFTGYLDVSHGDGRDLFFYFFESRGKPKEDPVIMWINGGPGQSSALGLFMELGPCTVNDKPTSANDTTVNPYSWNQNANVFFLDQPLGVGFSHAEHGQNVKATEEAAMDVQAFVQIFFDTFKEYEGREFHMAGESYGGRYLPIFASAVLDGNRDLRADGKKPINLNTVMIGNGVTDLFSITESYYPYLCQTQSGMDEPVHPIGECVKMAEAVPRCHDLTRKGCLDSSDYVLCRMAIDYCWTALGESFMSMGLNPYDISKSCSAAELEDSLCYPETKTISNYLNLPDVRRILGVIKAAGPWSPTSYLVFSNFRKSLDQSGKTWLHVSNLLERGVRVLNYAGTYDFICNHIGNERWMEQLVWSGKEGYNAQELAEWKVDGKIAGSYKAYRNLSLLKVLYAGHMVPLDNPKEALAMLTSWIGQTSFAGQDMQME